MAVKIPIIAQAAEKTLPAPTKSLGKMQSNDENRSGSHVNSRRDFIRKTLPVLALALAFPAYLFGKSRIRRDRMLWQIDPHKCVQCGRCATSCVLQQSAVRCVHAFKICGYCKLCGGYFSPEVKNLDAAAENQLCPMGAIKRKFIEDPYYQYTIDEKLCVGCGKCVKACAAFGNGSLFLQVRHDLCMNCNECAISRVCAGRAFTLVPQSKPYIFKGDYQ